MENVIIFTDERTNTLRYMKQKITFRQWVSVFFGGIWQFICNIFSRKNKTPFWRVIWATITVCILAVTCMLGYSFYNNFFGKRRSYRAYYSTEKLGPDYSFYRNGKGKSYIFKKEDGKKILKGLDWVARSEDGDSLVVFAKDGKRGFFNRYTGTIDIPAKYDAAWCFNDGVAGVCDGDSVFFIDHTGHPINAHKYKREIGRNYAYNGQYSIYSENGKVGLINRSGDIAVEAIYDNIIPMSNKMWNLEKDGLVGTVNLSGVMVLPCEYKGVFIHPEGGMVIMMADNSKKRTDYDGNIIDEFVYDSVDTLEYYSDEFDESGNRILKAAKLGYYTCNYHHGLMDQNGNPLTPPIYTAISAISPTLYSCQIGNGEYLMLNEKGVPVN